MVKFIKYGSVYEIYDYVIILGNVFWINSAYGLMDEFIYLTMLSVPVEDVKYQRLYNL